MIDILSCFLILMALLPIHQVSLSAFSTFHSSLLIARYDICKPSETLERKWNQQVFRNDQGFFVLRHILILVSRQRINLLDSTMNFALILKESLNRMSLLDSQSGIESYKMKYLERQ